MRCAKHASGVTLIELMIVVVIVAIIASVAFPSYASFTRQANRTDATQTMQMAAQSLERCYSRSFTYLACNVNGTVMNNGSTMQTPNQFYTITFAIPDAQDYTLTAVPVAAPQTADSQCTQFTLSSNGAQAAQDVHASDTTKTCWGSNQGVSGAAWAARAGPQPGDADPQFRGSSRTGMPAGAR
jgi:type IV pilus assembly protein PilE